MLGAGRRHGRQLPIGMRCGRRGRRRRVSGLRTVGALRVWRIRRWRRRGAVGMTLLWRIGYLRRWVCAVSRRGVRVLLWRRRAVRRRIGILMLLRRRIVGARGTGMRRRVVWCTLLRRMLRTGGRLLIRMRRRIALRRAIGARGLTHWLLHERAGCSCVGQGSAAARRCLPEEKSALSFEDRSSAHALEAVSGRQMREDIRSRLVATRSPKDTPAQ